MRKTTAHLFYALALPVILIAVWYLATRSPTSPFAPEPVQLVQTFRDIWVGPAFLEHVVPSLARLALGLACAIAVGIGLGLIIGTNRFLRDVLEPLLEFFRAIPAPVLVPILMLLIGIGDGMKIAVIVIGCTWPILLNTIDGARSTDLVLQETARSYGIGGLARFRYLILPSASPRIMAGIRQAMSIGLILVVISEMFAAVSGLGYQIVVFQRTFKIPEMWSGIALLGIIGLALAVVFQQIERVVLRWYHGLREVENRGTR